MGVPVFPEIYIPVKLFQVPVPVTDRPKGVRKVILASKTDRRE
jgi:hypothetical protein